MRDRLLKNWHKPGWLSYSLLPLSWLYRVLFCFRTLSYKLGLRQQYRASLPLIVVGNLTVGGTGKTPLVIALVALLKNSGYSPGVISRGYSGHSKNYPLEVNETTSFAESGDEPALIFANTNAPVVVDPIRARGIKHLVKNHDIDVIISDDGLQHLAMHRDIEICIEDKTTSSSNTFLLPAGPYRESKSRLKSVDLILEHVTAFSDSANDALQMKLRIEKPKPLVSDGYDDEFDEQKTLHAVAGIGKPDRFFDTCKSMGWTIVEHRFPDHYQYAKQDLEFDDDLIILMTEKDARKYKQYASSTDWY